MTKGIERKLIGFVGNIRDRGNIRAHPRKGLYYMTHVIQECNREGFFYDENYIYQVKKVVLRRTDGVIFPRELVDIKIPLKEYLQAGRPRKTDAF